jgi:hypothetical protein
VLHVGSPLAVEPLYTQQQSGFMAASRAGRRLLRHPLQHTGPLIKATNVTFSHVLLHGPGGTMHTSWGEGSHTCS